MIIPNFTFDETANGYLSDEIVIQDATIVKIELASRAPIVTLKQEEDGGWANYGQSPKDSNRYEITIRPTGRMVIKLATPVRVQSCHII